MATGNVTCFHNTCRHRGAELCQAQDMRLKAKLITCPYHEWAYDLQGHLVRVPYASPTPDFRKEDHGLLKVHVKEWNGFLFVCLADDAAALRRRARSRSRMPSTTGRCGIS